MIPVEREEILVGGDHHSFARRGIPAVSFYAGTLQPYYHRPGDEPQVVDVDWLARVTRFATATVKAASNEPKTKRR